MNATGAYIPDHIRLKRTDRLYHIAESLRLTMRRLLPSYWTDETTAYAVQRIHLELALIDAELHRRHMACRPAFRAVRDPRYIADRR